MKTLNDIVEYLGIDREDLIANALDSDTLSAGIDKVSSDDLKTLLQTDLNPEATELIQQIMTEIEHRLAYFKR